MTTAQTIAAIRARIADGTALPGDASQLAALERFRASAADLPGGQCSPAKVVGSQWGKSPKYRAAVEDD